MNEESLIKLDYVRVKETLLEYAVTYAGRKRLEALAPAYDVKAIRTALRESDEARKIVDTSSGVPLPSLTGLEGPLSLLGKGYVLSAADLGHIAQFFQSCAQWNGFISRKAELAPALAAYASSLYDLRSLTEEIERCVQHGFITDAASPNLHKVRKKIRTSEERIKRRLDDILHKHRSILQEALVSQRGGRYTVPVKKEFRKRIPGTVLDESASGQTVYVEPTELAELQSELSALRAEEAAEEEKVLLELTGAVEARQHELNINVETVGHYDFVFSKGKYAAQIGGNAVEVNGEGRIRLKRAIHPFLKGTPVPLDIEIGGTYRALIITGPNTGGKTVALKTVGLLTLMAQSGLLVPAAADSTLSLYTNVEADIGDNQNMDQSLSTFSSHIRNVIRMLNVSDSRTLVLIDELATGTDPGEGIGLSIAVLEELYNRGATVIATTHYNEIKRFAEEAEGFENARMEFDLETLRPLHRLTIGQAGSSYAFHIAQKLGIASSIVERARQITAASSPLNPGTAASIPVPETRESESAEGAPHSSVSHAPAIRPVSDLGDSTTSQPNRKNRHKSGANKTREQAEEASDADLPGIKPFEIGDRVFIPYLKRSGVIVKTADALGNLVVMIQKQKTTVAAKRVKPYIDRKHLYPDNYDMDIVFESKENRKKRKLMNRKHVEGLTIITPEEDV